LRDADLVELTVSQAAAALRERACSCREYVQALIARCEAQAHLNAFVSHDWETLLASARAVDGGSGVAGPLAGVPLALKDNIDTTHLTTSGATGALAGFLAPRNAPVAAALFDAGALLGAKANMHELAFGITNNNAVTGAARNPWGPSMIPGGSSGGTAVAVAARMMPAGIGTDTGGSVRLPAALCGLAGFRPSIGRYPGAGIIPISHTRDTAGPLARTVADVRLLDAVMAGAGRGEPESAPGTSPIPALAGLRLGVPRAAFYRDLEPEVAAEAGRVLDLLADRGVALVEAEVPDVSDLNAAVGFPVALYEFVRDLPRWLAENGLDLSMNDMLEGIGSPDVRGVVASQLGAEAMPEAVYRKALEVDRPRLQRTYAACFAEQDVEAVIFPTSPVSARPVGDDETIELNGERVPTFPTFIRNTDPGSNAGIPGLSLPTGLTSAGLPIGMELDGPAGSDERLLAVAAAVEEAVGFDARPGLA
jgi:mandelamide amidase